VILAQGKPSVKANLIFEEWDINIDKQFSREELTDMTSRFFKLFVEASMELVLSMEAGETCDMALTYHRSLLEKKEAATDRFIKLFMPESE
jgi:hypothetical protein